MPASPTLQLTALLLLPAVAASAARLRWSAALSWLALAGSAVALAVLPADAGVAGLVGVTGFGRGACWISLVGAGISVFAVPGDRDGTVRSVWTVHLLAVATILTARSPLLLLLMLLLVGAALPGFTPSASSDGWRRSLGAGGVLVFGGLLATQAAPPSVTDLAIAGVLVLGFLMVVGAIPFGAGLLFWLRGAGAPVAAATATSLGAATLAALVDNLPPISRLQLAQPTRAGLVLAIFGAATLTGAALYSFGTRTWHDLAAAGVLADIGLALVGVGALRLDGAALVLTLMALIRPLMFMLEGLDMRGAWARVGAAGALLGVAGMPPFIGFAARLLVLAAAFRLNAALAGLVLVGLVLQLAASARAVLAQLNNADSGAEHQAPTPAQQVAIPVVVGVSLVAGFLPGVVLSRVWGLG
jgi:hypothetical protein